MNMLESVIRGSEKTSKDYNEVAVDGGAEV